MASPQDSATSTTSFLSTATLVLALLFSVVLLGAAGYSKYRLDQSQSLLASPDAAFTPEQEIYEKTIIALGYSGFIGSAQNYMHTGDRAALADMRTNYQTASQAVERLAARASAPVRRDVRAILAVFSGLIDKADTSDALNDGITNADLLRASSALAVLEPRLHTALASQRLTAGDTVRQWGLWLMLMAWLGAVFIAAASVSVFLAFRSRLRAPLNILAQSVDNMVNEDVSKPVWGLERSDAIGNLARSIENARLYFSEIPDVSMKSPEGTIRFKFEAKQRSAFENMIKSMTQAFDEAQQKTEEYKRLQAVQQDTFQVLTSSLSTTLCTIQENSVRQEDAVDSLATVLSSAAERLSLAHKNSMLQVDRLAPVMQERIETMAEITQLAGTQVKQSLESLLKAERSLRESAGQSQTITKQLGHATNQMGERMFASLNLMQASGKSLSESAREMREKFNEAISTLGSGETQLQEIILRAEKRLDNTIVAEEKMSELASRTEDSAEKMERVVESMSERHEGLSEQIVVATHRMESIVSSFDSSQRAMSEATQQVRRDGTQIGTLLTELRANNDQLLASINKNSQSSFTAVQSLAEKSHALMQRLEVQIQQHAQATEAHIDELSGYSQTMVQQTNSTSSTLSKTISSLQSEQEKLATARGRFVDTITDISARFEQQATNTFGKTEQWAAQSFAKLSTIADQVDGVVKRLGMLGQLTGTLGTVAGQLGQLVPTLTQVQSEGLQISGASPADVEATRDLIVKQSEDMMGVLQEHWHSAVVQIEAMHDQLAQLMGQQKDQLETRLVVLDKKLREATDEIKAAYPGEEDEERKARIMNEIIGAVTKINQHVMEIDGIMEDSGLKQQAS